MNVDAVFDLLDLNNDGELSRSELHVAAKRLKWHWNEAPLFALIDLFSIPAPIPKHQFTLLMQEIMDDPMGVYGNVLLRFPYFSSPAEELCGRALDSLLEKDLNHPADIMSLLEHYAGSNTAHAFQRLQGTLETICIDRDDAALLIIDPQRSFTKGVWMRSIGAGADIDITPIRLAFDNCVKLLQALYRKMEIMFTRCPFPPESYGWDDDIASILDDNQLYFIKPGNNVLFPPTNSFKEWVKRCIDNGKSFLVIGGCTLNSCVRVSAIQIQRQYKVTPLQVMIDLSLSGARLSNFEPSRQFGGVSAVESAVHQMKAAGVYVLQKVSWE
jgi:nicotinamidase-related amidase